MQFPAGTTVETITMTTKEYSHRMDERIVYHDNVGVPIEDMILQALDPRSHLHARCGLSQRISDEHFCEKGYVCSYTVSVPVLCRPCLTANDTVHLAL